MKKVCPRNSVKEQINYPALLLFGYLKTIFQTILIQYPHYGFNNV